MSHHLSSAIAGTSGPPGLLEAVLDCSPRALVIVGPGGKVAHLNAAARQLLEHRSPLHIDGGRLLFREAAQDAEAALEAALAGRSSGTEWVLVGGGGTRACVVTVTPLPSGEGGRHALLLVQELPVRDAGHQERLRKLFGLSAAEAAVAAGVAEGATPREIAASRGVAESTVRVQLKSVMRKLGCRRQAEIAARVCGIHPVSDKLS